MASLEENTLTSFVPSKSQAELDDRRTIMIVDDNAVERMVLASCLSDDYEVLAACGGEEAFALLEQGDAHIAAIVLDIVMPEMDGFEVMRRLRSVAEFSHIPIIVSTFLEDDQTREKAIAYGANGFVTKPYNRALLLHSVKNTIRLRDMVADAEHSKAEQKQKELLDNLPVGAALFVVDGKDIRATHINRSFWRLMGLDPDERPDISVFDMVHPDDHDIIRQEFYSAIRQQRDLEVDVRIPEGEGSYKPFHVTATITAEANDAYTLFASLRPITDEAMAIQEMLPIALSTMMSSSDDLSYVMDKDCRFVCCSKSVARLVGLENERDIFGKTNADLFGEAIGEEFTANGRDVIESGIPLINKAEEISKSDGGVLYVNTSIYPIMNINGNVIGLYSIIRDVSQERKLNFELDTLLNTIPSGVLKYSADEDEQFEYINRNFVESLGYTQESFREKFHNSFNEMLWHEDREWAEAEVIKQEGNGEIGYFDYRVEAADGQLRWIHDEGIKITDQDGKSWYYVTLVDITDRVEAEQRQRELLDNLPCGAALYEFDGQTLKTVQVNIRFLKLIGRDDAIVESEDPALVVHPDDRKIILDALRDAIKQKRNVACDIRLMCAENEYHPFHMEAQITEARDGKYMVYTAYSRILEQDLTFRESLPFIFSMIMESSTDLSFAKDRNFRYLCCSRTFAELLGLESESEVVGKTDFELFSQEIAEQFRANDAELVAEGRPMIDAVEIIPAVDGRLHYIKSSKHLLRNTAGEAIGIYGVGTDITESRETYAQLKLMTDSIPSGLVTYLYAAGRLRITYCNNGFCEMVGTTIEDIDRIVETDPVDYVFEEDRQRIFDQLDRLVKTDSQIDCIYRIHVIGGGYKWVQQRAVVSERRVDAVFINSALFDITTQQEAQEKLRVSEEINRLAIEHSGKIVAQFDVETRTLTLPESTNPAYSLPVSLDGLPEKEIELGRISPETAEAFRTMINDVVNGHAFGSATYQQKSNEGWRWIEARYTTVFSSSNKPVSAVVTLDDVTEKLEKEVVYHKWQQSLTNRPEESYTLFRCNLNKNTSFESREGTLIDIELEKDNQDFDDVTAGYVQQVYTEDRERYTAFVNADTLLAGYYRGHRAAALEYREIQDDETLRWLRLSVELVEYPNSRDVEAYLMYENINDKKLEELQTKKRADTDALTGVLNRTAFVARMEEVIDKSNAGAKHALLLIDIDDFKRVNDSYGHEAGDQVLRDLTKFICAKLRPSDLTGRLGGDEFFAFIRDVPDEKIIAKKAKQICKSKVGITGTDETFAVSIGIAMAPLDGNDFDELYKKSDIALYRQKAAGKNGFKFYKDEPYGDEQKR